MESHVQNGGSKKMLDALCTSGMIERDDIITGMLLEYSDVDTIKILENCMNEKECDKRFVHVNSVDMYLHIADLIERNGCIANSEIAGNSYNEIANDEKVSKNSYEIIVNTKYKTTDKKVKPVAMHLPMDSTEMKKNVAFEPMLRDSKDIGHKFTNATLDQLKIGENDFLLPVETQCFRNMIANHGKAFAFESSEIGCVDPTVVEPMIIFTVPHIPWNLRPIPVPRAQIPQVIALLKEKIEMGILEPSDAPYSNKWFTVPKKNGSLRFIQDLQPVNRVTIRNVGVGPIVDAFAEAFAGRAIYSMCDLYSGYDQFQLAIDSRDITTIRTPIGLMRMCTLPQGATNSVAHMVNAMNKILRDFVPKVTMPFLDDVPIKGCSVSRKDERLMPNGCRKFVADHIHDCERILSRLEEVHLTFSGQKSMFGVPEILVVGHMCGPYGRKPSPIKVNAIQNLKDNCKSLTEVRRFLGACVFYRIWIPHFAHVADPLYGLLKKNSSFLWTNVHTGVIRQLKEMLLNAPVLRKARYDSEHPIIVTVDTSPIGIGWAISQEEKDGLRYAVRFGAKILTDRQRAYPQIKRELWGMLTAIKTDREYLIGAEVVIETYCRLLLGMISSCETSDIAMLRWIAYIKSLCPEIKHIAGVDNPVADMLSRARFKGKNTMVMTDEEDESFDFFSINCNLKGSCDLGVHVILHESEYEGEMLQIGKYLSTHAKDGTWSRELFHKIRKKAYKFFLHEGYLWRHPKAVKGIPQRVVGRREEQHKLIFEFHDTLWAGHRGVWATYSKLKEKFWWTGMYNDVAEYVQSCENCQMYSNIRHRDGLQPTYSLSLHYKWVVDIVMMPVGVWQMRYLVLAREDLTNQVEGRALRQKTTSAVCKFLLEDVICRYGCIAKIVADRGELDSNEAEQFFSRMGIRLSLTTAYNPEANGKAERGHGPIVKALVKACDGKMANWPHLLPYALWADRTTHNSVTGFMPSELILGQKPIMPVEQSVFSWIALPWADEMNREDLLALRIRQLERRDEDVQIATERMKQCRLRSKERFDKTHRLRPRKLQEGDWVIVYDSSLDNQHSTSRKFAKRWFGPYVIRQVNRNATYFLTEMDGAALKLPIAGKRIKLFKKREDQSANFLNEDNIHEAEEGDVRWRMPEDAQV